MSRPEVTTDALFGGALSLRQPRQGYRANVDALLLAAFAAAGPRAKLALDLGAGVGTIGIVVAHVGVAERVVLLEREPRLVALARENLADNGCPGTVVEHDLERPRFPEHLAQRAELVLTNPPFYPPRAGTASQRAPGARSGELTPFVRGARRALRGPRSRAVFCYPAAALAELFSAVEAERLIPKRLRLVHARAGTAARLALVELRLAKPGGLVVEPPLFEWESEGKRTLELERIVRGELAAAPSR